MLQSKLVLHSLDKYEKIKTKEITAIITIIVMLNIFHASAILKLLFCRPYKPCYCDHLESPKKLLNNQSQVFPMDRFANKIKKELQKRGATDIIIATSQTNADQIKFTNNKISTTQTWKADKIDIFIAIGKRIATTSLKEFTDNGINKTVNELIALAKNAPPNEDYSCIAKGPFKYKNIDDLYDKKITTANKAEIVEKSIQEAINHGGKRISGILETGEGEIRIISSGNVDAQTKSTSAYLSLRALADKDASGHITTASRTISKFNYMQAAKEAGEIAKKSLNPKTGISGKYDIIFMPLAFTNLLSLVAEATSVFAVESGFSFLVNKLNKKVASNMVSLYDDPQEENGLGSIPFDAEGHPTMKKAIIEKGILKTYLHNSSTAKRYKTKSTGNAGIISPTPFNTVLKKGDYSEEELIKATKNGLLVTNLWYTRFTNYATGEFSTIPRDGIFFIKNGKIQYPVKGIRISDSFPNILQNVTAVGNEPKKIISWEAETPCTTPAVLVKNINVTKPTE